VGECALPRAIRILFDADGERRSLQKTGQLLRALEKQGKSIRYYALDVSLQGLTSSVSQLSKELSNPSLVEIIGLWGTYDDCVSWISTPSGQVPVETSTITFLWMGNSISNMEKPSDASALLSKFKQASEAFSLRSQFLIAADACEDADMVQDAYDCQTAALKAFILNGLSHVNDLMGDTVFHLEDWSCESEFDPEKSQLEVYYTPLRDVTVNGADGETYHFSKGHRIRAICSGKWGRKLMFEVASAAGLQMNHAWGDCAGLYCTFISL
jgi:EasF-like predicted methyltransferase